MKTFRKKWPRSRPPPFIFAIVLLLLFSISFAGDAIKPAKGTVTLDAALQSNFTPLASISTNYTKLQKDLSNQSGLSVSMHEIYNDIQPDKSIHYYSITYPPDATDSYTPQASDFTVNGTGVNGFWIMPVDSTLQMGDNLTLATGKKTGKIDAKNAKQYILAVSTNPFEDGELNFTWAGRFIDPALSACGSISSAGTYVLSQNILGSQTTCINIVGSIGVVQIDGTIANHYYIDNTGTEGILDNGGNQIDLRNLGFHSSTNEAYLGSNNVSVVNCTFNTSWNVSQGLYNPSGGSYWTITNNTFYGMTTQSGANSINGMLAMYNKAHDILIQNNTFNITGSNTSGSMYSNGIILFGYINSGWGPDVNFTINGNIFSSNANTSVGINLGQYVANSTITNNTFNFSGVNSTAILASNTTGADTAYSVTPRNITIWNNIINMTGSMSQGIFLNRSTTFNISNNTIISVSNSINLTDSNGNKIINNTLVSTANSTYRFGGVTSEEGNNSFFYNNMKGTGSPFAYIFNLSGGSGDWLNTSVGSQAQGNFYGDLGSLAVVYLNGWGTTPYKSTLTANYSGIGQDNGPGPGTSTTSTIIQQVALSVNGTSFCDNFGNGGPCDHGYVVNQTTNATTFVDLITGNANWVITSGNALIWNTTGIKYLQLNTSTIVLNKSFSNATIWLQTKANTGGTPTCTVLKNNVIIASATPSTSSWTNLTEINSSGSAGNYSLNSSGDCLFYGLGVFSTLTGAANSTDNSGIFSTAQALETAILTNGSEGEIVSDYYINANTTANISAPRAIAYYPFDDGTANDKAITPLVGNGATQGAGSEHVWMPNGAFGGAISFNGAGYIQAGLESNLSQNSSFTIFMWGNNSLTNARAIFGGSSASSGLEIFGWNGGSLTAVMNNPTAGQEVMSVATTQPTGWYQVAFVYSNVTRDMSFYVNGALIGNRTSHGFAHVGGDSFWIGNGAGWNTYDGAVDEVRIYNQSLNASMISQLYRRGFLGAELPAMNTLAIGYNTGAVWSANTLDPSLISLKTNNATIPQATMLSIGTGLTNLYANVTIPINASASNSVSTFDGFNLTIYNGTTNQSQANFLCNNGFCLNSSIYIINNDTTTHKKGDVLIFSAMAYSANGYVNSSYMNSSSYTVNDSVPSFSAGEMPIIQNVTSVNDTLICSVLDGDGIADITGMNASVRNCVGTPTVTAGATTTIAPYRLNRTFSVTGLTPATPCTFVCGATDASGVYAESQPNTNTTLAYTDNYGPETQTQIGEYNASVNWSMAVTTNDAGLGHLFTYTIIAQQVKNTTISDKNANQVLNTGTTAIPSWTGNQIGSPYTVSFQTEPLLTTGALSASTTLGSIASRDNLTVNGSTNISMQAVHVFSDVQGVTSTMAWVCYANISANSACSDTTIGNWTSKTVTPDGSGRVFLPLNSFGNMSVEWTYSHPTSSGGGGGGGGSYSPPPASGNVTEPVAVENPSGTAPPSSLDPITNFINGIQSWLILPNNALLSEIGLLLLSLPLVFFTFRKDRKSTGMQVGQLIAGLLLMGVLVTVLYIGVKDWSYLWINLPSISV